MISTASPNPPNKIEGNATALSKHHKYRPDSSELWFHLLQLSVYKMMEVIGTHTRNYFGTKFEKLSNLTSASDPSYLRSFAQSPTASLAVALLTTVSRTKSVSIFVRLAQLR